MPINAPLSGEPLRQLLRKEVSSLRTNAGIRVRANITTPSDNALGALRYLGKSLNPAAHAALSFMVDMDASGALKSIGFTIADFQDAQARVVDTQLAETTATTLAQDAHAEAVNARAEMAEKTITVINSYRALIQSPLTDPVLKAQAVDAGGALLQEVQGIKDERLTSRSTNSDLRDTKDALSAEKTKTQLFEKEKAARDAQKDLKLQFLAGEALRPEDLVVTDPAAPADAKDEEPAKPVKRRKGTRP